MENEPNKNAAIFYYTKFSIFLFHYSIRFVHVHVH